jgi:hypothetical protein
MLPGKILRFLDLANVAFAGTRDRHLVPHGHRVSGWIVGADARTLTALIPASSTPHLIESLLDNGEFAMTTEEFPAHETYQFKGRYLRHRGVLPEDVAIVDRIRERFYKSVRPFQPPELEDPIHAFVMEPALAVEFDVREIYDQTPGPGAGRRLVPAEPAT